MTSQDLQKIAACQKALSANPNAPELWYNLGNALARIGRADQAIDALQNATSLNPSYADAWNNLAAILHAIGRFEEAIQAFEKAVALEPQRTDGLNNLGSALLQRLRTNDAIEIFERALQVQPDDPLSNMNLGIALLLTGQLKKGFEHYESRWKLPPLAQTLAGVTQPLWNGGPLNGRRLLIHAEQGYGDTLQFIRYIAQLPKGSGRIDLVCPPALVRLFQRLPGIDGLIPTGRHLPEFDLHCPLLSLPRLLGTTLETILAAVPYLSADPNLSAAWKAQLPNGCKVGLVWAGHSINNMPRAIPLELLAPLSRFGNVSFISLQRDQAAQEALSPPAGMKLLPLGHELADFADTAALISNLDLLISIDTASAHLAGAMGKPVWVLLPFFPDWRWMLDREDSPWYPTMRLFRQPSFGDWNTPIARIVQALDDSRMSSG